jgi:hypothetical protein
MPFHAQPDLESRCYMRTNAHLLLVHQETRGL